MEEALLDRLVALLHNSGLREIEFEEGDVHIRLTKGGAHANKSASPAAPVLPASPARTDQPKDHDIVAGLTGTFYRSSSPDAAPFVAVGDHVEEGQTIGLLEAMKMLTPIEADRAGRISAILAENAALVTRGSPLFRLAPDDAA